jgi:hypothetical protein
MLDKNKIYPKRSETKIYPARSLRDEIIFSPKPVKFYKNVIFGMFDTINESLFCCYCGKPQDNLDFQTKDLSSSLSSWTFEEINNCHPDTNVTFYTTCKFCKKWIEINFRSKSVKEVHEKDETRIKEAN